ncbi:MAG TPA: ELWxxDGT repeat protein, partial [Tepidisphaeraceae bacterium]
MLSTIVNTGLGDREVPPLWDPTDHNGTLLYVNDDGVHGPELWRSDGSQAGTTLVKDVRPGADGGLVLESSNIYQAVRDNALLTVGHLTFFVGDDGQHGVELWESDGSAAGTVLMRDIATGTDSSTPTHLTNANGRLFFFTTTTAGALQLWTSDGTTRGTLMVRDLGPSHIAGAPDAFIGIVLVGSGEPAVDQVAALGGTLYFIKRVVIGPAELWKSDGTSAGTARVPTGVNLDPARLYAVGGRLLVVEPTGGDVWHVDPSSGAATRLSDFPSNTVIEAPIALGAKIMFAAAPGDTSFEVWASDGTPAGTRRVFQKAVSSYTVGSFQAATVGDTLFFCPDHRQIYTTDGTTATSAPIYTSERFLDLREFVGLDGALY